MIQYESQAMVYKSVNRLASQDIHALFIRNSKNPPYERRRTASDFQIPNRNTANDQKVFSFRGGKLWKNLSTEIKSAPTINSFKKSLK